MLAFTAPTRLGWEAFKNLLCGRLDRSAVAEIRPLGRDDHGGAARSRADRDGVPVVGLQDSEGGLRFHSAFRFDFKISSSVSWLVSPTRRLAMPLARRQRL
jgi:hypothetical protein